MADNDTSGQIERLRQLEAKLKELDLQRQRLAAFKKYSSLGLIAIIGLFGWQLYAIGKKASTQGDAYKEALTSEIQSQFAPDAARLQHLAKEKLLPALREELKKEFDKRLPKWEMKVEQLSQRAQVEIARKLEKMIHDTFADIERDLAGQLDEKSLAATHEQLERVQERVLEHLQDIIAVKMDELDPKLAKLQEAFNAVGAGPESVGLTSEVAERRLVSALLDLLKYDLDPEAGVQFVTHSADPSKSASVQPKSK
ncbi:MAG: hypothetical protein RL095_739 [Verrucomicrobiota bacterium]|jgi:hypothetical protein